MFRYKKSELIDKKEMKVSFWRNVLEAEQRLGRSLDFDDEALKSLGDRNRRKTTRELAKVANTYNNGEYVTG